MALTLSSAVASLGARPSIISALSLPLLNSAAHCFHCAIRRRLLSKGFHEVFKNLLERHSFLQKYLITVLFSSFSILQMCRTLLSQKWFNTRNKLLTQKLLKQCYRYHKLRKTFSKFYRRYYDLISKFQVGLKSLLRQGLSEPDFYGDLVYKLKKIVGSNNFSAQFIKIISHYKKIGYNINVLQQTACLVVNPITVCNFAFLFNCTPVGRTSDSMMVPT